MDYKLYTNTLKALLHLRKKSNLYDASISISYNLDIVDISLHSNENEVILDVRIEDDNILKIKVCDWKKSNAPWGDDRFYSFCNGDGFNSDSPGLNYVELNPNEIMLYCRDFKSDVKINIDNLECEHFQYSTIDKIHDISFYEQLRDMYWYYNEFVPSGNGVAIRYYTNEKYFNDNFRDFITTKVWGLISLV